MFCEGALSFSQSKTSLYLFHGTQEPIFFCDDAANLTWSNKECEIEDEYSIGHLSYSGVMLHQKCSDLFSIGVIFAHLLECIGWQEEMIVIWNVITKW